MMMEERNSIKHIIRLIVEFSKRPDFWVVIMVVIVAAVTVIGLISSVSDKAEDERDLLRKLDVSENEIIFNASLRYEENGSNNAILYHCTLDDEREGVGIILAGLKDGVWQIELDKRQHLDSDVMYFTGEYSAGSEKYSIYTGYIASPDAVEVRAVTTDGTEFESNVFKKVSNRSYFLLDVPSKYSHPEINILDKDGKIINSVGSGPEPEPSAENKTDVITYKPVISEEAIKLKSLEKTYMDSDYYRQERMIPLTVVPKTLNIL